MPAALPIALFCALIPAQIAYSYLPDSALSTGAVVTVGIFFCASATDAALVWGARRAALLLGLAGAIGFTSEVVGVASGFPFGSYAYGGGLGPELGGVPLLIALAWAMMARPSWVVAGLISERRALRIALAAGALCAWDLFLDPQMTRDGFWSWHDGGSYEGIPFTNFCGWLVVGLLIFGAWTALRAGARARSHTRPAGFSPVALALYVWTWVGETFAHIFVWQVPKVALVGFVGMGLFALPALLRLAALRPTPARLPGVGARAP